MTDMPQESFDRLLKAALTSAGADTGDVHPDAEVLAAWYERTLDADAMRVVDTHLSSCEVCRTCVATLAQVSEPEPDSVQSLWQRWGVRWLVPAGAAAVLALWIVWPRGDQPPTAVSEGVQARLEEPAPRVPEQPAPAAASSQPVPRGANAPAGAADRVSPRGAAASAPAAPVAESAAPPAVVPSAASPVETRALAAGRAAANEAASPVDVAGQVTAAKSAETAPSADARRELSAVAPTQAPPLRWRIVAGRRLERTSADGAWVPVELPVGGTLTALSAPGGSVCWVVGSDGLVLVTSDGTRFTRVTFPQRAGITGVRAADGLTATVTTVDGRSYRTSDQGVTWMPVGR